MVWDRTSVTLRGRRLLLAVGVFLAVPGVAQAATVTNTSDHDPGSLRAIIEASSAGDTIDFAPALNGQTITLAGPLIIPHGLTITGPGSGSLTIDGAQHGGVFDIESSGANSSVTISGLTITGGALSGTGATGGGGILDATGADLNLQNDAITGNQATVSQASGGGGGGVFNDGGDVAISGSTIDSNTATITGAVDGENGGGGVYSNGGDLTITGSDISANTVEQDSSVGGGNDGGGGIYTNGGNVEITSSTVDDNSAIIDSSQTGSDGGGGIYTNGGDLTLNEAAIDDNTFELDDSAAGDNGGGGVYNDSGDVTLELSSIDDNTAEVTDPSTGGTDGGGALVNNGGDLGVVLSSISENSGDLEVGGGDNGGGAILDLGIQSIYLTSTLSGNSITFSGTQSSGNGGGAIRTFADNQADSLTIAGNSINAAGGGISSDASFTLTNTVIADNTATSGSNCAGPLTSEGFNLESANTCGLNAGGDQVNTDPRLGPLANNGGPTRTRALPAGSPAVDAGSCNDISGNPFPLDQREVARPQPTGGRCDIGAYELVQGGSPPPSPPPSAPPATVPGPPAATSSTGASFSGSVNPQGQATTVFFQYGIDSRFRPGGGTAVIYDQSTTPQTLTGDSAAHAVTASASGLVPNALYHVRLVATNATGTTLGPDQTFTTPSDPAPPPPVLGQKVNAKPVSGRVFILVGTKLVPLTEARQIPSGAILDTRAGSLQLTTAAGKHKRETGTFGGAIFKLTQARNGLTNLALAEGAFHGAPSYATCKVHKAADASAAASKTLQLLHASAKGTFKTTGRYSAATVRGTKWTIADRCDGTLTRDLIHSVVVSDFVRHKTIVLHAGQSYLAKAPGHK